MLAVISYGCFFYVQLRLIMSGIEAGIQSQCLARCSEYEPAAASPGSSEGKCPQLIEGARLT